MFFYVNELLSVNLHERKTAYRHSYYSRPFDVLCCRLEGETRFGTKKGEFLSKAASVVFIPRDVEYSQVGSSKEKIIAIHFLADTPPADTICVFNCLEQEKIISSFEDIFKCYCENSFTVSAQLMSKFYQLISNLFSPSGAPTTTIDRAMAIFEANFLNTDFSVGEWASLLGVSRTCLQKLCKQERHLAPCAYLKKRRLEYAAQLLITSNHTVKSIGLMCGYYSDKNFIVSFSSHYNMSPSEYRRNNTDRSYKQ